jgi:hypothetical protein
MDSTGAATASSPDTSFAASPGYYTLQADVPAQCAVSVPGYPYNRCIRWAPAFPPAPISATLSAQFPLNLTCQQQLDNTWADLWVYGWDAALGTWVQIAGSTGFGHGSCSGLLVGQVAYEVVGPIDMQNWVGHVFTALRLEGHAMFKDPATGVWSYVPVTLSTQGPPPL